MNDTSEVTRATLTILETAKILGIGRAMCYDLAPQDLFPGVGRLGRRYVISRKALARFIDGETEH